MTSAFLLVVGLAVQAWAADGSVTITQITKGPNHHFFGGIGQSRTIPWNASGRYLLALQTSFQDHMPDVNDPADVCLLDAQNGCALRVVDQSRSYNPQPGTMFYGNPQHPETQFFFNHTLNNRNNDLIYFFCRADFGTKPPGVETVNVAFTVRPDGSELTRQEVFIGGHPDWEWGSRIIGSQDKKQVVYDAATQKIVAGLGGREVLPNPEGDISLSPDGRWFVNGHGAAGANHYTFLERRTGRVIKSPPISFGKWKGGDLRLDPATLQVTDTIKLPPRYPAELTRPKTKFPGIGVRWTSDLAERPDRNCRYVLRWESLGSNRDKPRSGPIPEPTMLTLYGLSGG